MRRSRCLWYYVSVVAWQVLTAGVLLVVSPAASLGQAQPLGRRIPYQGRVDSGGTIGTKSLPADLNVQVELRTKAGVVVYGPENLVVKADAKGNVVFLIGSTEPPLDGLTWVPEAIVPKTPPARDEIADLDQIPESVLKDLRVHLTVEGKELSPGQMLVPAYHAYTAGTAGRAGLADRIPAGATIDAGTIKAEAIAPGAIKAEAIAPGAINVTSLDSVIAGVVQRDLGNKEARFETPGTYSWTVPQNVTSVIVNIVGGGGGGGGGKGSACSRAENNGMGGGGGSGTVGETYAVRVVPGNVYQIIVGAGGAGGALCADGKRGSESSMTRSVGTGGFSGLTAPSGFGGKFPACSPILSTFVCTPTGGRGGVYNAVALTEGGTGSSSGVVAESSPYAGGGNTLRGGGGGAGLGRGGNGTSYGAGPGNSASASSYGAGGGGGGDAAGGNGAGGLVAITWF